MTGVFSKEMNAYFNAKEGAYTEMTDTEIRKMTYNVKAVIRDLLIKYIGYDNIPRAGVTESQSLCFILDQNEHIEQDIQCKFSKTGKDEMTIYIDKEMTKNNTDSDIWYVFFREDIEKPFIGVMRRTEWEKRFFSGGDNAEKRVSEEVPDEVVLDGEDDLGAALAKEENGYPMYNIKVERGFYTVYELKRKYDSQVKRIILDAEFQRESVWKPSQKAELIESILMGLPLPIFYFNQDKLGRLIVVDGRQRLTALFEFMAGEWPLRALKVLKELNGKKFSDLDPVVQAQIEDYQIQAHVIQPPTPDRIKFDIFDRVNRAGTQLNKQEIRNALYQGNATELLKNITANPIFEKATEGAFVKDSRMKGKYILLRFISFELYFAGKIKAGRYEYKNDIDELLGLTMETINEMSENEVSDIAEYVIGALKNAYEIVGENAFRLVRSDGSRSPINMNVFETVMHIMKRVNEENYLDNEKVRWHVKAMKENVEFLDAIGNHRDNYNKVNDRFAIADSIFG